MIELHDDDEFKNDDINITPTEPHKFIRCPSGCGALLDFTFGLRVCDKCSKQLCKNCIYRIKHINAKFCKACHKDYRDKRSRHESIT